VRQNKVLRGLAYLDLRSANVWYLLKMSRINQHNNIDGHMTSTNIKLSIVLPGMKLKYLYLN
jgi:hypothetical protein